ncbi:MAG: RNA polymerase sigma factor [Proteobacteria bacterium]|nr:RNA polymerase sigma factor [Pseudomonadota bacterium]MDA0896418.1 RNA polymerase sigma factor [Pseudomonadota bacterium]MDA1245039.1 RNA polymerase sigma factor [Pseudomonadota bacterium]
MGTIIDEDQALVAAAVKGSEQAWIDLVVRYESRIYNQALRLTGNSADALDLMQEVFIGIYKNLHRFRGESKFSSWVFRIVHNKSIDLARRWRPPVELKSSEEPDQFAKIPSTASDEPDEQIAQEQTNAQVQVLLGQLPIEQRLVVELKLFQSQTFEEISISQDISENTAKTRFYSALKKLKDLLEKNHAMP